MNPTLQLSCSIFSHHSSICSRS
uniref:Uncharacterized protein n=1 Tax=Megaselia scalaris TaxID=36166 RepID=T1H2G0_MEGSC